MEIIIIITCSLLIGYYFISLLIKGLTRKKLTRRKQLEEVPELIQHIQSLLPENDAARTCVLSKSWLHAWSTIPTLRFSRLTDESLSKQHERSYIKFIKHTIRRYHQDNIPIITCDLYFAIHNQNSATRVEKSIKSVAFKSSLKELRLTIFIRIASFTLPDEIFSNGNLNTLKLEYPSHIKFSSEENRSLHISSNPLIDCVNLRVLELTGVHISDEVFHNLVSTCKLLEKINLEFIDGLTKIKVNNLRYLQQLKILPGTPNDDVEVYNVEIYDVPSLGSFYYDAVVLCYEHEVLFKMGLIRSLRELCLESVFFDDAFSDMINSKFPFLESLTLKIKHCNVEIMDIRCATLQRLEIELCESMRVKVQIDAPKLLFFLLKSKYMPSLLFPTMAPEQIELLLQLFNPIDHLLFRKIRETLNLSSKFNIEILTFDTDAQVPFKIDDVRTRVLFPATNVKNLSLLEFPDNGLYANSELLFDAFFSICQPMYVKAHGQLRLKVANYFLKNPHPVQVYWRQLASLKEPVYGSKGKWEKLTSAPVRVLDGTLPLDGVFSDFKFTWSSP